MTDLPETAPAERSRAAVTLIAIGLVILIPSGFCTTAFGIAFLYDALTGTGEAAGYARGLILWVPIVGGPPIALGVMLLRRGLRRRRPH